MNKFMSLSLCLVALVITAFVVRKNQTPQAEVHYHAGFQVYVDEKLQDFSDLKYMSISPCADDAKDAHEKQTKEEIQLEKAHLHDKVGDVVHSHVEGALWGDLFTNLKYPIDSTKGVASYIDGKEVHNILKEPITPYQSVVILIGTHDDPTKYLEKRVSKEKIVETENKSESCGVN